MFRIKQGSIQAVACGVIGASALALAPLQPVYAADTAKETVQLEEVVVTARKREETLLAVPISVQAFSEKELKESGATDVRSLQTIAGFTYLPMVGTAASGRQFGALNFRGLAPDTGQYYENSGSLFIDGVFISAGLASVNTADVERAEVLKGPQNAFFGRSTFGGAINLITRNPAKEFQGHVNVSGDSWNSHTFDASIEGPIFGDQLTGRLLVLSNHKAGQYNTSDGGTLGEENTKSITGTLYYTPMDSLWVRLRTHYQEDDDGPAAIGYIPGNSSCVGKSFPGQTSDGANDPFTLTFPYICGSVPKMGSAGVIIDANTALPAAALNPLYNNVLAGTGFLAHDPFLSSAPRLTHSGMARQTFRVAVQSGLTLPYAMELDFNAGYNRSNSVAMWDLDRSAVPNFFNIQPLLTDDLTVDLRLATSKSYKLRGLLGVSYFRSTYRDSQIDLNAVFGATAFVQNTGNYGNDHAEVQAVYGSIEYDILDTLTASADMRYQKDKVTDLNLTTSSVSSNTSNKFLPRLILSWKPTKETNLYVSWAKGVQPLVVNASYAGASAAQQAYLQTIAPGISAYSAAPELTSYEIGLKQRLFNERFEYSLALFDSKWLHRTTGTAVFNPNSCLATTPATQLTAACPLPLSGLFITFPNDAHIQGIEFSSNAAFTSKWTGGFNFNYYRAKWDRYYNANFNSWTTPVTAGNLPARLFNGNTISREPNITSSLSTTFRDHFFGDWGWFVRGDLRYTGRMYSDDLNIVQSDPYMRVNAQLGMEKDKLSLTFYVNNLFNDTNWDYIYRLPNLALSPLSNFSTQGLGLGLPEKREMGLKLALSF